MRIATILAAFVLLVAAAAIRLAAASDGRRPNIILIFTDDQGYYDLGCQGHPTIRTPNIDRLAAEGTRFTDFYVAGSICIPSRRGLMTGCYPVRRGLGSKHLPNKMLPELLREAGYATGLIGKWHLGDQPGTVPTAKGFDTFFGTLVSNNDTTTLWRGTAVEQDPYDNSALTQTLTREALGFIDRHQDEPFFLYLAHNAPHWPVPVSKGFQGRSAFKQAYGDSIEEIDWSVGAVMERVKDLGLDDDTLVIYTSDNGPRKQDGGQATPYRGYKWSHLDGGQRVPCIMRWPGRIEAERVSDGVACALDLLPTLCRVAGATGAARQLTDGIDCWDFFSGETDVSPRSAFLYYGAAMKKAPLLAIRSGKWKYDCQSGALYDINGAPDETTDVAGTHRATVAAFEALASSVSKDIAGGKMLRLPSSPIE